MKLKGLLFLFLCFNFCVAQPKKVLQDGFVYVKDEIPTIHIELRYHTSENFVGKIIDGYYSDRCILSEEATLALKKVQQELLRNGLSLKIYDAYRPQRAVDHFVVWAKDLDDTIMKSDYYPDVKKQNLFKEGYISSHSGHTKGSTVDLTLVYNDTGEELDMGSPFDFFGKESWVNYQNIMKQQQENRLLLKTVMNKHGFKSYSKEWWHFTLVNEPFPNTYFDFPIEE